MEPARGGGHFVELPDDVATATGGKHMLRVKGMLAGAPYRSNLAKMRNRLILGAQRDPAGRGPRYRLAITIEPDREPR